MSPQPNEQDNKNILNNEEIDSNASELAINLALASEDEPNGISDESDGEAETDYAGYKLLQQDDAPNGFMDSSDDEEVNGKDENGHGENGVEESGPEEFADFQSMETAVDMNINYQNLHCTGLDDFPPSSMGFPDLPVENESSPEGEQKEENMSDTQVELVMNAMAGFSLPAINIPEWAKNMSEDEWQKTLNTTVQKKK